jgi:hypothetical protein
VLKDYRTKLSLGGESQDNAIVLVGIVTCNVKDNLKRIVASLCKSLYINVADQDDDEPSE